MAAIAAQVGDIVELFQSAALGSVQGLFIVRAIQAGGYVVSTPENPAARFSVLDSDISRVYTTASSGATIQTPTEAILVSGIDATLGSIILVTLSAARVVGAPLKLVKGQELEFTFIQGGAGAWAVTWNAIFKKTWSDVGNATAARTSIKFRYDGTNLNQSAGQSLYV